MNKGVSGLVQSIPNVPGSTPILADDVPMCVKVSVVGSSCCPTLAGVGVVVSAVRT